MDVNTILNFLTFLAEKSVLLDQVLIFYGVDEVVYVVSVDRECTVGYIVYVTDRAEAVLCRKFGDLDTAVRKIVCTALNCLRDALLKSLRLSDDNEDVATLLFTTYYRNVARRSRELRVPDLQLHIHHMLPLPVDDRLVPILVMSMNVRDEVQIEPIPREKYDMIVNAVRETLQQNDRVVEAYLFGNREKPRDVDIALVIYSSRDDVWTVLTNIFYNLCKKYEDVNYLASRLDLFVYARGEEDELLKAARSTGVKII